MITLLVFARAPVAGLCKTRLIPRLGARGAAWVQRRLVEHLLDAAQAAARASSEPMRLILCGAPDARHHFFKACQKRYGAQLERQSRGDLGQRMRAAIRAQVAQGPVLLVGSDAFGLGSADLLAAVAALKHCDYTVIGAPDGGYVLIGARKPLPSLAGVAWSSGRERMQTLRRLREHGSADASHAQRSDFDTARDWQRARRAGQLAPLMR